MIQKLPTTLTKLQATAPSEWVADCWRFVWMEYNVVPVVFDCDGCDDALKEHVEREFRYRKLPREAFGKAWPSDTVIVDITDCQDWECSCSDPLTVFLLNEDNDNRRAFRVREVKEFEIGPKGHERVFRVFELEDKEY